MAKPLQISALQGSSVRLEPMSEAHFQRLIDIAVNNPGQFDYTGVRADKAQMEKYLENALHRYDEGRSFPFVVVTCHNNEVVGSTRYDELERWPEVTPQPDQIVAVEIGWTWLDPSVRKTAVNTEAKLLLLKCAFEDLQVMRVTLKSDERNATSRNAIEAIGAKFEGIRRCHVPPLMAACATLPTSRFSIPNGQMSVST